MYGGPHSIYGRFARVTPTSSVCPLPPPHPPSPNPPTHPPRTVHAWHHAAGHTSSLMGSNSRIIKKCGISSRGSREFWNLEESQKSVTCRPRGEDISRVLSNGSLRDLLSDKN